eukprot:SAG31_NODE_5730_length_2356_cov_1.278245_3_plen_168_part_00
MALRLDPNNQQAVHGLVQQVRWLKELADSGTNGPGVGGVGERSAANLVGVADIPHTPARDPGEGAECGNKIGGIQVDVVGWQQTVPDADTSRSHVEYQMQVTHLVQRSGRADSSAVNTASGDRSWEVSHRFSSFLTLHKQLTQRYDRQVYGQTDVVNQLFGFNLLSW